MGEKGRRGPEERSLILTTRIRAKKRIRVRNRRRGKFFVVNRLSSEVRGGPLRERGDRMGRVINSIRSDVNRVMKNSEIGWVREIGWFGERAIK